MKFCAACHQDLPKDKFSKKQWKLGAHSQRRCTSCVRDNREVVQPPSDNNDNIESANKNGSNENDGIVSLLDSISLNDCNTSILDEDLFKQPPQNDDECPICMIRMPWLWSGRNYNVCCGKIICGGCIYASDCLGDQLCPFCRVEQPKTDEELIKRIKKRIKANDPKAIFNLGCKYDKGSNGFRQNNTKALELWHRAGKLGCTDAYYNIGNAYLNGRGVQRDMKKARHYWGLAAMEGDTQARYNLGASEDIIGNMDRALKHYMIAVEGGHTNSLTMIRNLFMDGHATKDDYGTAIRSHQAYLDEIKSIQRDEAAAARDGYNYPYC